MINKERPMVDLGTHQQLTGLITAAKNALTDRTASLVVLLTQDGMKAALFANKCVGVRCCLCQTEKEAQVCRKQLDCNCLSIASLSTKGYQAVQIIRKFWKTDTDTEGRELGQEFEKERRDQQSQAAVSSNFMKLMNGDTKKPSFQDKLKLASER